MACSYTFNGEPGLSYQELISKLSNSEIDAALAILFSLSDKQTKMYDAINEVKKDSKFKQWEKSNFNSIDGEPPIDV